MLPPGTNGNIAYDQDQSQLFALACILAVFGGILIGVIVLTFLYCLKENASRETPQENAMRLSEMQSLKHRTNDMKITVVESQRATFED